MTRTKIFTIYLSTVALFIGVFPVFSFAAVLNPILASTAYNSQISHIRSFDAFYSWGVTNFSSDGDLGVFRYYVWQPTGGTYHITVNAYSSTNCSSGSLWSDDSGNILANTSDPLTPQSYDFSTHHLSFSGVHSICGQVLSTAPNGNDQVYWGGNSTYGAWYEVNDVGGGFGTYIKNVQPYSGASTSSPVTISALVHVGTVDITNYGHVEVQFSIAGIGADQGIFPSITRRQLISTQSIYGAGDMLLQTVQSGLTAEQQVWIQVFGNGNIIDATTTVFTVGTSTPWGQINILQEQRQAEVTAALTGTSTAGSVGQCAVVFGSTSAFSDCVTFLFVPSSAYIGGHIMSLLTTILHTFPFGYATRVVEIFQAAHPTTDLSVLPSLVITMPIGFPGAGTSFDLTPWTELMGDGTIISTATNPNTGHTLRQIVEPMWDAAVYAMFVLAMAMDLLGMSKVGYAESETFSSGTDRRGRSWRSFVQNRSISRSTRL